jgi:hypothetical protein
MFASAATVILLCWCIIHILSRYLNSSDAALLPTDSRRRSASRSLDFQVNWCHLKIETTAWNHHFDALASRLALKRNKSKRAALKLLYSVGVAFGIAGMTVAIGTLCWSCVKMMGGLVHQDPPHIAKRGFEDNVDTAAVSQPLVHAIVSTRPRLSIRVLISPDSWCHGAIQPSSPNHCFFIFLASRT